MWLKMADIGIVGYGFVGMAVNEAFKGENNILFYDIDESKKPSPLEEVVRHSEFIFVCLPTPFKESKDGKNLGIDLTIIDENIRQVSSGTVGTDKIIIIKSTVIPGTTQRYAETYPDSNFCFSPEFLREAYYLEDAVNPDRIVIGAFNNQVLRRVIGLHKQRFPYVKIISTNPTVAEMIKYANNSFLAMKVMYANEMHDLCEKLGIEWEDVKEGIVADRRIGETHLEVTSDRGYGGKCFPKDVKALLALAQKLGIKMPLLTATDRRNEEIRKRKDWLDIPFVRTEEE